MVDLDSGLRGRIGFLRIENAAGGRHWTSSIFEHPFGFINFWDPGVVFCNLWVVFCNLFFFWLLRNFLDWLYLVVYLWPTINKILFIYKKRVGPGTWYLYTNEKYLLGSWWGEQVNSWKVVICSYLILSSPICTAYWFTCAGSQWVLVSISCYEHTKFPLLEIYVLMYKNKNIKIRYQNEVLRYKRCLYVTYCIPCRVAHYVSVLVPCTRANRVPGNHG